VRLILHHRAFLNLHPKYLTMRYRQRRARKGKALKIHPGRSWHLDIQCQVSLRHLIHLWVIDICHRGRWKPQDAALGSAPERLIRYMGKLHISQPSHLDQTVPAQVWILMQDHISAPPGSFGKS
jgi:hypothetical protein